MTHVIVDWLSDDFPTFPQFQQMLRDYEEETGEATVQLHGISPTANPVTLRPRKAASRWERRRCTCGGLGASDDLHYDRPGWHECMFCRGSFMVYPPKPENGA